MVGFLKGSVALLFSRMGRPARSVFRYLQQEKSRHPHQDCWKNQGGMPENRRGKGLLFPRSVKDKPNLRGQVKGSDESRGRWDHHPEHGHR